MCFAAIRQRTAARSTSSLARRHALVVAALSWGGFFPWAKSAAAGRRGLHHTLIDVKENEAFADETVIDRTRVVVRHGIEPSSPGRARVVYSTVITGPAGGQCEHSTISCERRRNECPVLGRLKLGHDCLVGSQVTIQFFR
jgi:hypothetical protein